MTAPIELQVNRRRVLLVCPVGDEIGGAEQVMLTVARRLPAHGFEPTLVVMRPGRLVEVAREMGLSVEAFGKPHRYRDVRLVWRASGWLADVARRTGAVLMHATHTAHLYAAIASRRSGVAEVWHLHDTPSPAWDVVDWSQRMLPPAHTIATTAAVAEGFGELGRRPFSIVAPSCVDPNDLRGQARRADVRKRLQLPENIILLLTVTRLQGHKGHADLIDAAIAVLRERANVCFVVVGKASTSEQEKYQAEMQARAKAAGVAEAVRFVGYVNDSDLAELYRQATALVHPARSEGYGLVLLEAMGMGLPVVAAAATGPAEIICDGENGLLVPVGNPAELAKCVLRVLTDNRLSERLRAGGLSTSARLTVDTMLQGTVAVYRHVLGSD